MQVVGLTIKQMKVAGLQKKQVKETESFVEGLGSGSSITVKAL
jgi:hypothetical protein